MTVDNFEINEEDHTTIVSALKRNYPLLLGHDEFRRRLADEDKPTWIECFNYLIELGVIDNRSIRVFRVIERIHEKFESLYDRIEPELKVVIEEILFSLQYADSADDALMRLEGLRRYPSVMNGRHRRTIEDLLRSAAKIVTHGRSDLYDSDDERGRTLSFNRDEQVGLLRKDLGGAVKGGAIGTLNGGIDEAAGFPIGLVGGLTIGAIISSAGQAAETLFDKVRNIFRRRK